MFAFFRRWFSGKSQPKAEPLPENLDWELVEFDWFYPLTME